MNDSSAAPLTSSCEALTTRYEQLRQQVMAERGAHTGFGLALFLREGMAAWMKASAEGAPVSAPLPRLDASAPALSWSMQAEATSILVAMALEGYRGVAQ